MTENIWFQRTILQNALEFLLRADRFIIKSKSTKCSLTEGFLPLGKGMLWFCPIPSLQAKVPPWRWNMRRKWTTKTWTACWDGLCPARDTILPQGQGAVPSAREKAHHTWSGVPPSVGLMKTLGSTGFQHGMAGQLTSLWVVLSHGCKIQYKETQTPHLFLVWHCSLQVEL